MFVLKFLQARDPELVGRPFFARYDPKAAWLDDLEPAFGTRFPHEMEDENWDDEARVVNMTPRTRGSH